MTIVMWLKSQTKGMYKTEQIGEDWLQVTFGLVHFHGDLLRVKDSRGILVLQYRELFIEKVYCDV